MSAQVVRGGQGWRPRRGGRAEEDTPPPPPHTQTHTQWGGWQVEEESPGLSSLTGQGGGPLSSSR